VSDGDDLSSHAQSLLREGRAALAPSDADRLRNLEGLRAKLGDAAVLGDAGASAAPSIVPALSAVVVALGVAGGVLWYAFRDAAPVERPAASAVAPVVAPLPAAPEPRAEPEPEPAAPATEAAPRPSASGRRSTLAQEVALMSRAAASLQAGRAAEALKTLEEHQQKFPGGVLSEERLAARVQALCALGRRAQAEAELARLVRTSPRSPQVVRARQACDAKR
jgi:hypothetical protein